MHEVQQSRRDQILDRSAQLFAEHGFHSVSITDIGRSVGISGPAVYRHFAKKDDILSEILIRISERLLDGAVRLGNHIEEPTALLDALISSHAEFAVSQPELIILQWREFGALRGAERRTVRRLQRTYVDYWTAVLLKLQPHLTIPEAGATVIAAFGLMNSTPFSASRLGPDEARPLLIRLSTSMFGY